MAFAFFVLNCLETGRNITNSIPAPEMNLRVGYNWLLKYLAILGMVFANSIGSQAFSQTTEAEEDISIYFQDGGLSKRKQIIALNLLSPLWSELQGKFERRFTKRLALDAGIAYSTRRGIGLLRDFREQAIQGELKNGIGFFISPHFYFDKHAPEGIYAGLRYDYNRFSLRDSGDDFVLSHGLQEVFGYNLYVTKFVMFTYEEGFGVSLKSRKTPGATIPGASAGNSWLSLSISLTAGFGFFF